MLLSTSVSESYPQHKHDIGFENYPQNTGSRYGVTTLTGNFKMSGYGQAASTPRSAWTSVVGTGQHVIPISKQTLFLIRY